jgi:ABC-type transport system substrate-binding protein
MAVVLLGGCAVDPPPAPQSTETPQAAAPAPKATQIIMAIDSIGAGFNPHLLSDQSPVNASISALVLPSAFRPVPDPASPSGSRWQMDPALLVSAQVTATNPFTVTYKIRPEAAWTDNAPIAADDFWYQWRQIVSQPGVVDPAGYDLITGVQSLDGGKKAVVTFSQPYPAWRELFNHLLPAHIVKDVPGGFLAGLSRALPVTGGQFRVDTIDPQRDEILLARNDRFWGSPAKPDQILFRRAGVPAALADSIRNGDTQVAQVHGGAAAFAQLSAIPDVRTARTITPRVMQLTLRAQLPKLSDPVVRKAILGLLDVELLAAVGAGSDNSVTLDQSLVRAPSDPGYVATAPEPLGRERALELFAQAGFQVDRSATESPVPPSTGGAAGTAKPARGRISRYWRWTPRTSTGRHWPRTRLTRSSAGGLPAVIWRPGWHRASGVRRWKPARWRPPGHRPDVRPRKPRRRRRNPPIRRRWCAPRPTSPVSATGQSSRGSTAR